MADRERGELHPGSVRGVREHAGDVQLVGERLREVAVEAQNLAGGVDWVGEETPDDVCQPIKAVLERGRDTKVAATSVERPEEVGVRIRRDAQHLTFRSNELDRVQVVCSEALRAYEPAEAASERQAGDTGRRYLTACHRQPMQRGFSVELTPGDATLRADRRRGGVDVDPFHLGEVDHQAAVRNRSTGHVVAPAPHGDLEACLTGKRDRVDDVGRAAAAGDERRPLVDQAVMNPSRVLVAVVSGLEQRPGEHGRELFDPLGVERFNSCHSGTPEVDGGRPSLNRVRALMTTGGEFLVSRE